MELLLSKEFLGVLASVISTAGYIPYLRDMLKGRTRPHIFSWVIWTLLTGIVFFAQVAKGAGPGAWVTGVTCVVCIAVVALTIKQGDRSLTRSDWVSFVLGLVAIPLWKMMNDPTLAVVLVTFVYSMAYFPTFRKSYERPFDETLFAYILSTIKFVFSIMATESFSITTLLYPLAVAFMNIVFIGMVLWRRRVVGSAPLPA